MIDDKDKLKEGYSPSIVEKGYQPSEPSPKPDGGVEGGYRPVETGEQAEPPGDE